MLAKMESAKMKLERIGDWQSFIDALGLLAFGVLLFPRLENYIDAAAVEAFLAQRDRQENPTMAVLANTYYTLTTEKRGQELSDVAFHCYTFGLPPTYSIIKNTPSAPSKIIERIG
ncbi:hypothetical protein CR513_44339, partial [Mucuna pruriens]